VVLTDTWASSRNCPPSLRGVPSDLRGGGGRDLILHVVDAADLPARHHIETTDRVLTELSLEKIPRSSSSQGPDRLAASEGETLRRGFPARLVISALHRETTRKLLDRIAQLLEGRWRRALSTRLTRKSGPKRTRAAGRVGHDNGWKRGRAERRSNQLGAEDAAHGDPEGLTTLTNGLWGGGNGPNGGGANRAAAPRTYRA